MNNESLLRHRLKLVPENQVQELISIHRWKLDENYEEKGSQIGG